MISATELAAMQAVVNSALDVTFTQKRTTPTQGPTGNVIDSYSTVNAALKGNLAQPSAQLLANYEYRVGDQASWLVRVPVGTDLRAGDRLVTSDGNTLDVQVLLTPQSYQTAIQAICAEVK